MTAKPLVFDNTMMRIEAKHILANAGYPLYGFRWIEIEDWYWVGTGVYLAILR